MSLHLGYLPVKELEDIKKIGEVLVDKIILNWNMNYKYTSQVWRPTRVKNLKTAKKRKDNPFGFNFGANCQMFVLEALKLITDEKGIELGENRMKWIYPQQYEIFVHNKRNEIKEENELFVWWLDNMKKSEKIEWKFKVTKIITKYFKDLGKEYDHERTKSINFKTHEELDMYVDKMKRRGMELKIDFSKDLGFNFHLLKGIDRGFWLRYQSLKLIKKPTLKHLEAINKSKPWMKTSREMCCPFKNPTDRFSFHNLYTPFINSL